MIGCVDDHWRIQTRTVYDAAAMRWADAIAIMLPVTDDPNAGQALRAALRKSQGYRRVLCVRPLVSLQPLSGKSRAAF